MLVLDSSASLRTPYENNDLENATTYITKERNLSESWDQNCDTITVPEVDILTNQNGMTKLLL